MLEPRRLTTLWASTASCRYSFTYFLITPWRWKCESNCSSTILHLGTRWKWMFSCTLGPLHRVWKILQCPLHKRVCAPQSRSECCRESSPGRPARLLYLLSYPGSVKWLYKCNITFFSDSKDIKQYFCLHYLESGNEFCEGGFEVFRTPSHPLLNLEVTDMIKTGSYNSVYDIYSYI
jgi:hypothetical protein